MLVVHDLLADVDRRAVEVQRLLDGDHGPVDPGAVAARRGQQHGALGRVGGRTRGVPRSMLMCPIVWVVQLRTHIAAGPAPPPTHLGAFP